jgi:UDP-N-acetylmuramoylalanine--D-glutamate ligase
VVLITGGTDKNLDFSELAVKIKTDIEKNNLFLLKGSGTAKLLEELKKIDYFENSENIETYGSFEEIANSIKLNHQKKCAIIFSPGAASFELFKNEFDRGEKFNIIIKNKFN